jgi:hypothetical protein
LFEWNGGWIGAYLAGSGTKHKSEQYHAELTQNNNVSSIFEEPESLLGQLQPNLATP